MSPAGSIRKFFHSIRFELLVYYMSISIVVLAVGSYLVYNSTINIIKERSEEYIREQFKQSEYSIQNLAKEVDRLSTMFLIDGDIQEFLNTDHIDASFDSYELRYKVMERMNEYIKGNSLINSIYIFSENQMLGRSQNRSVRQGKEHKFYTSGMYDTVWKAYPKAVWNAGFTDQWFYDIAIGTNANYIISFARAGKPIISSKLNSVIAFNINERDLCSTYSQFTGSRYDSTYIMDSKGVILSSIRKEDIGKKGAFIPDAGVDFKSFNMDVDKTRKMIVYYNISQTGWYIVREIPMGLLESDVTDIQKLVVIVFAFSFLLIAVLSFYFMKRITDPLSVLAAKMKDMGKGNLGITFSKIPKNELGLVITGFNEMSLNIRELVTRNTEVEREKKELEIEALQYQINPHFLYNTLNMIKWMAAVIKAENILDSVVALGNILRPLFNSNNPLCTLREEVNCLENYIKIMNWRFKYKILFKFDIPEHIMNFQIIKFILQPVIENSVVHGMGRQSSGIEINIHAEDAADGLLVRISDNGIGMPEEKLMEIRGSLGAPPSRVRQEKIESIGLNNVNRRIKLNFGEAYGVSVDSEEGVGTRVTILLPKLVG